MVGTANDKKSAPLSTSKRLTALSKPTEQPARDRQMSPAAVSTRNVLGERQTALDDGLALTPECRRPLVQHFKVTKHLRHFCVL